MELMKDNKRKDLRSKKKLTYEKRVIIEQYLKDRLKKYVIFWSKIYHFHNQLKIKDKSISLSSFSIFNLYYV